MASTISYSNILSGTKLTFGTLDFIAMKDGGLWPITTTTPWELANPNATKGASNIWAPERLHQEGFRSVTQGNIVVALQGPPKATVSCRCPYKEHQGNKGYEGIPR